MGTVRTVLDVQSFHPNLRQRLGNGVDVAVQVLVDRDPAVKNHLQTGTEAPEGLVEDDSFL